MSSLPNSGSILGYTNKTCDGDPAALYSYAIGCYNAGEYQGEQITRLTACNDQDMTTSICGDLKCAADMCSPYTYPVNVCENEYGAKAICNKTMITSANPYIVVDDST